MTEIFYEKATAHYLYDTLFILVFFGVAVLLFYTAWKKFQFRFDFRWQYILFVALEVFFVFAGIYSINSLIQPVEGSVSISDKEIVIHDNDGNDLVIPKERIISWNMKSQVRAQSDDKEIWEPRVVGYKNLRIDYYKSATDKYPSDVYLDLTYYTGYDQLKMYDTMEKYYSHGK